MASREEADAERAGLTDATRAGRWRPRDDKTTTMPNIIQRFLRLYCHHATAEPQLRQDGVLALAAVNEEAELATLLLVDMARWGRNGGASVTDAVERLARCAHRHLVRGFGVPLEDTRIVTLDREGRFDLVCDLADGLGLRAMPLYALSGRAPAGSRDAFLSWAGPAGVAMLDQAEAVGAGAAQWSGAEG
jgi:hypothetical protein